MEGEKFCGLDVHKESIQACILDEKGNVIREQRFANNSIGLNKLLNQVTGSRCVMESSTSCFSVYDFLNDKGITVRVAHPKKLKAISSAKVKTDKIDAMVLAQLERTDYIPEAYIPSKETRQLRDLAVHHLQLTKQKTRVNNQLKALLTKNGIAISTNPFTKTGKKLLDLTNMPQSIRLIANQSIEEYLRIEKDRDEIDQEIEKIAKENKNAVLLKSMPGVGWLSAFIIATQIDKIERFPSPENLVSYAGLCPTTRQSGENIHTGKINKDSCRILRWILIQDAWASVKHCQYFKKIYKKLCKKKTKQKAIVGIAKRMLTIMYFMLRDQTVFKPKTGDN